MPRFPASKIVFSVLYPNLPLTFRESHRGDKMHFNISFAIAICWVGIFLPVVGFAQDLAVQAEQQSSHGDMQAIESVLAAQVKAWNEHRIEKFMDTYWKSEELSFSSGGETTLGWQATLERYQSRYPDGQAMGKLRFDHLKVQLLSESSAYVLGEWYLKRDEDEMNGNFTLVLRKIDGRWKIIHDHTSLKKEEP